MKFMKVKLDIAWIVYKVIDKLLLAETVQLKHRREIRRG